MAKFELSKSVEGVKVNKRSGIPTTERVTVSFGAIIEDPHEERDSLRFSHLGEIVDVKMSEIKGYYKPIEGGAPAVASGPVAKSAAPVDSRKIVWESIPSSLPTLRAKVPGGWLVAAGNGLAFVPDSAHAWDGSSLQQ
ncbi:MAG: hypothetical protein JNM66_23625 [Bryobacterales bacterium]|nr:hypothetical protein [Bryobacterales bacterium]